MWGPFAGLSWSGTPAKRAHEMTPNMPYKPTQALYTHPSGLGPTSAYIRV